MPRLMYFSVYPMPIAVARVFLLAGPATNAATLTVIARFWECKATLVYLAVIACRSLIRGWLLNEFYAWAGLDIGRWATPLRSMR